MCFFDCQKRVAFLYVLLTNALTGYVNFLHWILLAETSVPMAQVGAKAAHKPPAKQLKFIFIAIMIYMGLKMIGVFLAVFANMI